MQMTTTGFVTQRVEHEHGNVNVELFAVFGYAKVATVHGAGGRAKARAAGVFKLLAGFEQGLMAHHAQAFDFFVHAFRVVHAPRARDQLGGHRTHIGDGDRVREQIQPCIRVGLLGQVLRLNFNFELVARHGVILDEIITP